MNKTEREEARVDLMSNKDIVALVDLNLMTVEDLLDETERLADARAVFMVACNNNNVPDAGTMVNMLTTEQMSRTCQVLMCNLTDHATFCDASSEFVAGTIVTNSMIKQLHRIKETLESIHA